MRSMYTTGHGGLPGNNVNEHKSVTPQIALRLSRAFPNTSPEFWLNLQKSYDLWHAARDSLEWQKVQPVSRSLADTAEQPAGHDLYPDLSAGRLGDRASHAVNTLRESDETKVDKPR